MTEISTIVPCRNGAENVVELTERVRAVAQSRKLEVELILTHENFVALLFCT